MGPNYFWILSFVLNDSRFARGEGGRDALGMRQPAVVLAWAVFFLANGFHVQVYRPKSEWVEGAREHWVFVLQRHGEKVLLDLPFLGVHPCYDSGSCANRLAVFEPLSLLCLLRGALSSDYSTHQPGMFKRSFVKAGLFWREMRRLWSVKKSIGSFKAAGI